MSVSAPNYAPTYIYPPLDSNPGQLYKGFKSFMQANLPGWVPYSGELDDWLARAFTGIQASLTEIASDVATTIYRYFGANIVNEPPYEAVAAVAQVTIQVQDANGPYLVPAFTQMSFPDASGNLQGFETTAAVTIPNGQTTASGVFVQAMTPGSAGNTCSGAGDLDSTQISFITGLTMTIASSNGLDAETDSAYLNRLTALFTTLTPSPITPLGFTVIAATQPGVGRATTLGRFNPAPWTLTATLTDGSDVIGVPSSANIPQGAPIAGTNIPPNTFVAEVLNSTEVSLTAVATGSGSETVTITGQLNQGGFVTTWVADSTGAALSTPVMAAIQVAIQAMCLDGVSFYVEAPTVTPVNISVSGCCWPGTVPSVVETDVEAALSNFLQSANFGQNNNPAVTSGQPSVGWLNDTVVRQVVLEAVCQNVPGLHFVQELTINGAAADYNLGGVVPLTTPGTISVTLING